VPSNIIFLPIPDPPNYRGTISVCGRGYDQAASNVRSLLQPNIPALSGVPDAGIDNPLIPAGMAENLQRLGYSGGIASPRTSEALDELGVRLVVSEDRLRGLVRVGGELTGIYERRCKRGRAWFEPSRAIRHMSVEEVGTTGNLRILAANLEPGRLVVSTAGIRGWRVTSKPTGVLLDVGSQSLLSLRVPAGIWAIELVYQPVSIGVGLYLSCLVLGFLVGIVCIPRPRACGVNPARHQSFLVFFA